MLKVLGIFTIGSAAGLVSFSHILNYVLKHYKNTTLSVLTGFIIGSLGVVWPWKKTIYKTSDDGTLLLDTLGDKVIKNYQRYIPELTNETYLALAFIILGVSVVLALDWYGRQTKKGYFAEKFENENRTDCSYENFDLQDISEFKTILKKYPNLKGLNVTIPYKEQIIPYLDKLNKKAKKIGAVNTIKISKKGKLTGYTS